MCAAIGGLLSCPAALAQDRPVAFTGAEVIPIAAAPIPAGTVVAHRGKIVAVGPAASTAVPPDAERIDATGRVIMPGLVDTHSHVGGGGGGDDSGPVQPDVRILDSINVRDAGLRKCRAGGLTTLNIMPGSGLLASGQTVYVKLRPASTIDDILYRDAAGAPLGGLKMANGTNSQKDPPFPGTRGKSAAIVRQRFLKALDYRAKVRLAEGDAEKRPDRDLELEALVEAMEGRRIVHHHAHRADDIMTVLRLRDEFRFKVVLHHVSEAWKVADEIAKAGAGCSVIVLDSPGGKIEAMDCSLTTGAELERAGVACAFHTDDPVTDSRLFLRTAALAVRAGMSREKALEALTLAGARMLDLDSRIGSLEVGKDADLIVLSGDPLSVRTKVLQTFVEGRKVFDRDDPEDRLIAVGGYGASRDQFAADGDRSVR
ncbi:MAG: amidohydrolase, partial [Planctomycetia bacterium]|nr:amidohydrolase [Planctomycetia bacterium]